MEIFAGIFIIILICIPGMIAKSKGRSFFLWFIYSLLILPIALIHSILIKSNNKEDIKDKQDQKINEEMNSFFQKINHQILDTEWVKETDITKGTNFKDKKEIYLRYKKEGKQDWDKDIDPRLFEEWCNFYIEERYIIKKERDTEALERTKIQNKEKLYTTLTDISGVSDKVARTLMDQFPTLESVKNGSIEDLSDIPGVGKSIAKAIKARCDNL